MIYIMASAMGGWYPPTRR